MKSAMPCLIAILITLFFGPLGAFLSYLLIAKWNIGKSLLYALGFFFALVVSALLFLIFIGYILFPIVWIVMLISVFSATRNVDNI